MFFSKVKKNIERHFKNSDYSAQNRFYSHEYVAIGRVFFQQKKLWMLRSGQIWKIISLYTNKFQLAVHKHVLL